VDAFAVVVVGVVVVVEGTTSFAGVVAGFSASLDGDVPVLGAVGVEL
jgi:hypothetical protein